MNRRPPLLFALFLTLPLAAPAVAPATRLSENGSARPAPVLSPADDTARNALDREPGEVTASDQSNEKRDVETTALIRRAVVQNPELSREAHNVKIITRGGRVVLKGPVASRHEKRLIEKIAADVAGKSRVTSRLEILGAE